MNTSEIKVRLWKIPGIFKTVVKSTVQKKIVKSCIKKKAPVNTYTHIYTVSYFKNTKSYMQTKAKLFLEIEGERERTSQVISEKTKHHRAVLRARQRLCKKF